MPIVSSMPLVEFFGCGGCFRSQSLIGRFYNKASIRVKFPYQFIIPSIDRESSHEDILVDFLVGLVV